ncbi:MAG: hypothetical protein Kow0074_23980 [Candidatus Zixiibacteriota bacterium]
MASSGISTQATELMALKIAAVCSHLVSHTAWNRTGALHVSPRNAGIVLGVVFSSATAWELSIPVNVAVSGPVVVDEILEWRTESDSACRRPRQRQAE